MGIGILDLDFVGVGMQATAFPGMSHHVRYIPGDGDNLTNRDLGYVGIVAYRDTEAKTANLMVLGHDGFATERVRVPFVPSDREPTAEEKRSGYCDLPSEREALKAAALIGEKLKQAVGEGLSCACEPKEAKAPEAEAPKAAPAGEQGEQGPVQGPVGDPGVNNAEAPQSAA